MHTYNYIEIELHLSGLLSIFDNLSSLKAETMHTDIFAIHRRIFGEGNGTPLQYSCLENPMDGGSWWARVHGVAESHTRPSNFTFTFHSFFFFFFSLFTLMHWRRKWQPTPVFLP